jgi:hypothetical protein
VSLAALVFGFLLTRGAWPASERSSESAVTGAKVGWHISARIAMPNPSLRTFGVAAGAGFVWVLTRASASADCARQCYVVRIDPKSNELVGEPRSLPADPLGSDAGSRIGLGELRMTEACSESTLGPGG